MASRSLATQHRLAAASERGRPFDNSAARTAPTRYPTAGMASGAVVCQRMLCPLVGMVEQGDRPRPPTTLCPPELGVGVEFLIIGEQSCLPVVTESTARLTANPRAEGRSRATAPAVQGKSTPPVLSGTTPSTSTATWPSSTPRAPGRCAPRPAPSRQGDTHAEHRYRYR